MYIRGFAQRHAVGMYFCMAFAISWAGALLIVAPNLIRHEPIARLDGLLMFPVMLLGPSVAGLVMTGLVDGRNGLRALGASLRRWRVGPRWYLLLLLPPALILFVLFALRTLVSTVFTPHVYPLGIAFGVVAGFLEEIGWTGFALPHMMQRRSPLAASLILGVIWGLWHLPVIDFLGVASPHGAYWPFFALAFVAAMTAMRVIIAWLFVHTNSVLLAQMMHASSTSSLAVLSPLYISPAQEALWYAVYAAMLWIVVALVAVSYSKESGRQRMPAQPLASQVAPSARQ